MSDGISDIEGYISETIEITIYLSKEEALRIQELFPQYNLDATVYEIIRRAIIRPEETLLKR